MICKFLTAILCFALAACGSSDVPKAEDPTPVLGCYKADEAPAILISRDDFTFEGGAHPLPFRYEFHKVGMMLAVPVSADTDGRQLVLRPSDDHFYRVLFDNSLPVIRVAFGPNGQLVDYRRTESRACAL